jgi:ribosomal protein S18 acetylase RimI-like enzyme
MTNGKIEIINVNPENIAQYPCPCFMNPKNEGYQIKLTWLKERFPEGLKIKLLFVEGEKKPVGFIEYIPGEYAWRAVDARGYMFIHCIWVSPNKYKNKGYGSLLIEECIKDAKKKGSYGVAVVTSEDSFMAGKDLFLKNGFESVASAEPSFELMVKPLKNRAPPTFRDWEKQLSKYEGLHMLYANQCPWVARSIIELSEIAQKKGLELKVTELKTAEEIQQAPSVYGTFNLVCNGKLLADHYISNRRFQNIIEKQLK